MFALSNCLTIKPSLTNLDVRHTEAKSYSANNLDMQIAFLWIMVTFKILNCNWERRENKI